MWRTLRPGGIAASAVALAMLLSGTAQPARADVNGASSANGNEVIKYEILCGGVLISGPPDEAAQKIEAAKDSAWLAAKETLAKKGQ